MDQEIAAVIFVIWSFVLVFCSARLWLVSRDLERQQAELRRWVRRHDEKTNRERI